MTLKPVEVEPLERRHYKLFHAISHNLRISTEFQVKKKRALTSTGSDYWAAHVGWAKIKTNTFYSTSTGFDAITL